MNINRQKFYALYKKFFGSQTQPTVDALNVILDKLEKDARLKNIAQRAYVLATAYHESGTCGNHFVPVKEGRERKSSPRRANQDRYWNTGYYGRGLIQTTWREKYAAIGELLGVGNLFVENPDLLLDINWAYEALVAGMKSGIYRQDDKGGQTLKRYLKSDDETTENYTEAREIVNGDKKKNGALIAGYAQHFEQILRDSVSINPAESDASRENSANQSATRFVEDPKTDGGNVAGSSSDSAPAPEPVLPSDEPKQVFKVEDYKHWVVDRFKKVWLWFGLINTTQFPTFAGIGAATGGHYWWIGIAAAAIIFVATLIAAIVASTILAVILYRNRKEISAYFAAWIGNQVDPQTFNYKLEFEKK